MLPQLPADGKEARTKEAAGQQKYPWFGRGCLQPALLLGCPSELPSLPCAPARCTLHLTLPWCSSITCAFSLVFSWNCADLAVHSFLGCGPQLCLSGYASGFSSSALSLSLFTLFISLFLCFASFLPGCLSISPFSVWVSTCVFLHLCLRIICLLSVSQSLPSPPSLCLSVPALTL